GSSSVSSVSMPRVYEIGRGRPSRGAPSGWARVSGLPAGGLASGGMSDLVPVAEPDAYVAPSIVARAGETPSLNELFTFASEAELRVERLRMRILDRTYNANGEDAEEVE